MRTPTHKESFEQFWHQGHLEHLELFDPFDKSVYSFGFICGQKTKALLPNKEAGLKISNN